MAMQIAVVIHEGQKGLHYGIFLWLLSNHRTFSLVFAYFATDRYFMLRKERSYDFSREIFLYNFTRVFF